jgi:maltooligosyltrehalose trehalohydrolase
MNTTHAAVTHRHRFDFGATLSDDGRRTRFRLWAPGSAGVMLSIEPRGAAPGGHAGSSEQTLAMRRAGGGWFELDVECGAGTRYRYGVSGPRNGQDADSAQDKSEDEAPGGDAADIGIAETGLASRFFTAVPDPASRLQAGDVHDPSVVVDPGAHAWQHTGWRGRPWTETVLYELHVGALGGYAGVQARLPALAALGVTAVELMPINDFPGARNWGYDGVLPFAPDAAYGTPEDLKRLIDAAHGLGLMVFLDVVYNHFGPDGNYLGLYAEPFFTEDAHTPWGQAIDFRRPEVSEFFVHNALYWLMEYRFDGLRFDAVHAIAEQGWLETLSRRVRAAIEPGRHVHLVVEHDGNAAHLLDGAFDAQWNDDGHHALHALLTGEHEGYYADYADAPAHRLARVLAEGFAYQGNASAHRAGAPRGEPSAHLPPSAFVLFLQNHDQTGNRAFGERLTALADPEALQAAMALLLLSPQIPLLFMGEEWGATEPFLYFTSHAEAELAAAVREGRRREFERFAAFADPARRERIPDPNDPASFERSCPREPTDGAASRDARAWRERVRALLALRHAHIVPRLPGTRSLGARALGEAAVHARWRLGDGAVLTIRLNLGARPLEVEPPGARTDAEGPLETQLVLFEMAGAGQPAARTRLPARSIAVWLRADAADAS